MAICGRSAALKARVAALAAARPADERVTLRVVGYTRVIGEYMAVADLVGKPGGLTTAEALARGLPMVIVHQIPGQEERTADHLLEAGSAIRGNDLSALARRSTRSSEDPDRLAGMRAAAGRRPRAAAEIVATWGPERRPPALRTAGIRWGRCGRPRSSTTGQ